MTADSVDLEDCNDIYKEIIGTFMFDDMNLTLLDTDNFHDAPKLQPVPYPLLSDMKNPKYDDIYSEINFKMEDFLTPTFDDPFADYYMDCKMKSCDSDSSLQNSSLLDMDADFCYTSVVSPDLILPSSVTSSPVVPNSPPNLKEDSGDEAVDSIWPEVSELTDIKLLKFVDNGCLGDELVGDELFRKKKRRKLTHLDFDHCYSQPPIQEDDDEEDDDDYDYSPYSPASSSCSGK